MNPHRQTEAEQRYGDIIDLPPHRSSRHQPMPLADRAAQFMPFAALTGHHHAVENTLRAHLEEYELAERVQAEEDFLP